ncbi:MAG TPA: helix-turn-helix transcriptional regulator [Acidiferrobacterales bacterium]|nr:helix-turn-helix transcriptional regulator [Acidiferrobacterales bacterium]
MTTGAKDTTLSTRLRAARQAAALTQTELAKRIGSDQAIISRLERGESMGTPDVLRAIGKELKVTVTYLLGEDTSDHAVRPTREAIASDRKMPKGLRDLATDDVLMKAMKITARELRALASIELSGSANKDGYVQLLVAIRAVTRA